MIRPRHRAVAQLDRRPIGIHPIRLLLLATLAALAFASPAGAHAAGTSHERARTAWRHVHDSLAGSQLRRPRRRNHLAPSCRTRACITFHQCSNQNPRACVWHVIYKYRIGGELERAWLLRIPQCESSWKPLEPPNSAGATGLFQFVPKTWASTPEGRGHPERIYSAYWQAFAAHWGYHHLEHGPGEWACTAILGL